MTDFTATLEAAHAERNRFIAFAFAVAELVLETNNDGDILFSAGAAESMFNISNDKLAGKNLYQLIDAKDRAGLRKALADLSPGKRMKSRGVTALTPAAPTRALRAGAYRLPNKPDTAHISISLQRSDGPASIASTAGKPTRTARSPASGRDAATGLPNKEAFADAVLDQIATLQVSGESCSLTMVDMGGLEEVRAHLEDGAEEEIYAKVGALLNSNALDANLGGRIDRGKLGFLHNPSLDIDALADSVEQLVRDASPWAGDFKLGTSTVAMDSDDMSEEDMGQAVLYTLNTFSESSGGNVKFGSLSEGCKDMLADTVSWQQRLKRTITDESFTLVYQPIVNLADGKIHHYETLTRLNDDPEASPYKFITMAEQLGKIAEFDWAVMQRAFKTLRSATTAEAIPIAVNISGLSLSTPEFVSSVTSILKLNADLKDLILFEVTESSKINDLQSANETLKLFRSLGVPVCLDDFGVGAAAFEYLRCLQVDYVKIDGSFVREAANSKFSGAFIKSISALCQELGIQTVAEFVEDATTARLMLSSGVHHGQGWHFGKPSRELPWDQETAKAAAKPQGRDNWDPTVGRRVNAQ